MSGSGRALRNRQPQEESVSDFLSRFNPVLHFVDESDIMIHQMAEDADERPNGLGIVNDLKVISLIGVQSEEHLMERISDGQKGFRFDRSVDARQLRESLKCGYFGLDSRYIVLLNNRLYDPAFWVVLEPVLNSKIKWMVYAYPLGKLNTRELQDCRMVVQKKEQHL